MYRRLTISWLLAMLCAAGTVVSLRAQNAPASSPKPSSNNDWPRYGGTLENNHYSQLAQINRENVKGLQAAWEYDTGEDGGLQTSPIVVNGILYGITPTQKVFALNAAMGELVWKFDSGIVGAQPDRGLAFWQSTDGKESRILVGVLNYLYALDAATGHPILSFGANGRIDLRDNLGREPASANSIYLTSPGVVFEDLIIVGGRMPETLPAPPGDVRAFDVRTGKLRWAFHTIPHPGEPGYETWPPDAWTTSGAANNWAGMTLDATRGIVYVPTGSAASDFYGTDRAGDDLYANCLLALDARTGKRLWHFQAVRHDIWDRDFPSPPVLLTIQRDGKSIEAVAQTSKQGFVYLFNRLTGEPLFPLEAKNYPASNVPGEVSAKQQLLPTKPLPFARQQFTEDMLTQRTPEAHRWALDFFKTARSEGQFVPLALGKETFVFPGFDGAAEWGGPALDPQTNVIYINSNEMAWNAMLAETPDVSGVRALYTSQCAVCHRDDRKGSPPNIPSLVDVGSRLNAEQIGKIIHDGKGRMPGFPNLTPEQSNAITYFLASGNDKEIVSSGPQLPAMKYHLSGYNRFLDPDGYPAIAPPWGTLNAINLNTGEYVWKIPFGEYPELTAAGLKNTGSENYGGPIVTAGGLLLIGASNFDKKFRAYNSSTGQLLWDTTLPFSGNATPVTYSINGRQFVVIAAGGGKDRRSKSGGVYVAFALPATAHE